MEEETAADPLRPFIPAVETRAEDADRHEVGITADDCLEVACPAPVRAVLTTGSLTTTKSGASLTTSGENFACGPVISTLTDDPRSVVAADVDSGSDLDVVSASTDDEIACVDVAGSVWPDRDHAASVIGSKNPCNTGVFGASE